MRKRRVIWLTVGCVMVAAVLTLVLAPNREPKAQGHALSYWINMYNRSSGDPQRHLEAESAIREIGTNALPFLLEWTDYEPSQSRSFIASRIVPKLPAWILSGPGRALFTDDKVSRAWSASGAFQALGPKAAPAIHELEARIQDTNITTRRICACLALCNIGVTAVPSIARIISSPNHPPDSWITNCVAHMGTNARPLNPLLLSYLDHTNTSTATVSVEILGQLHFDPDVIIPALTRKLTDPRDEVRSHIPFALAQFGSRASPALPQLTNALSDSNVLVRIRATNAIATITTNPLPP